MAMTNAEKQARWRAKRGAEFERLRTENGQLRAELEVLSCAPRERLPSARPCSPGLADAA
jgi:hypothetical protein